MFLTSIFFIASSLRHFSVYIFEIEGHQPTDRIMEELSCLVVDRVYNVNCRIRGKKKSNYFRGKTS
ncbi:hypothetical protein V1478_018150 [Vespula squamosa]|uniref:Secreted protein n=1 Tax=Vespula squamosa TaxID=30214 RepID=A0ABD1ZWV8_VESSQ